MFWGHMQTAIMMKTIMAAWLAHDVGHAVTVLLMEACLLTGVESHMSIGHKSSCCS